MKKADRLRLRTQRDWNKKCEEEKENRAREGKDVLRADDDEELLLQKRRSKKKKGITILDRIFFEGVEDWHWKDFHDVKTLKKVKQDRHWIER